MEQRLSARQEECLRLTAFLTDKEIAARLGLSEATVKKLCMKPAGGWA